MIQTFKTGRRGRPLKIDTEKLESNFLKALPRAKQTLEGIRQRTSGMRGSEILGTRTSLPNSLELTLNIIDKAKRGQELTYSQARLLKSGVKEAENLASRVRKSRESAIGERLARDYVDNLKNITKTATPQVVKRLNKIINAVESLTKKEKQELLLSRVYQDPRTTGGKNYAKVKAWAKRETGKQKMTMGEAWAYLLEKRIEDGLKNSEKME